MRTSEHILLTKCKIGINTFVLNLILVRSCVSKIRLQDKYELQLV